MPGFFRRSTPATGTNSPVTSLIVFTFPADERVWAFLQMAWARPLLLNVPGLRFKKMMGSGLGKVFSLKPDWGRYALLAVWEDETSARNFLEKSAFMRRYSKHAERVAWILLGTISAHGKWSGQNPFLPVAENTSAQDIRPIAILTRATIRPYRLRAFWRQAIYPSELLETAPGLISSIGIGEAPFVRQATFSTWESLEDVQNFAYRSKEHSETIKLTRSMKWYSEELFARFYIIDQTPRFP
ncbi:MAG TPA: hypothetical protein VH186_15960 [Chloroflexia bacterium]|nr:hypothetical protein [Chloroflexia bacterium]